MTKVGITVGKFMPLHKGHELMIVFGSKMMDKLWVVVSGNLTDSISVATRYNWVCEYVEQNGLRNVRVIYHIDQSPEPVNVDENGTVLDKEFQEYWVNEFKRILPSDHPPITHFVSSDMYGKTMAELLGIKWLPVDPKREMVKISGTMIRKDPIAHFGMISNAAKSHYVRKIAIVGPESSGKSTMIKQLAYGETVNEYGRIIGETVNEYGRIISEVKGNNLTKDDFLDIMNGQQALIDIAVKNAKMPIVLIDTEAYTTYLFSKIYLGEYMPEILEFGHEQDIDHYIVLSPNVDWVDDGTRVLGDQQKREQFFEELVEILQKQKKSFTVVDSSDFSDRFWECVDVVQNERKILTRPLT